MDISDFRKSELYSYETDVTIWGRRIGIGVDCDKYSLEECLPAIDKLVDMLDKGRDKMLSALFDYGIISLAEDWASSAEEAEEYEDNEDIECYIMEDGTKVFLPITEEDFAKSLNMEGINIYFDDSAEDINADVFMFCKPDYFACHSIEVFVDKNGNIDVNGLAG